VPALVPKKRAASLFGLARTGSHPGMIEKEKLGKRATNVGNLQEWSGRARRGRWGQASSNADLQGNGARIPRLVKKKKNRPRHERRGGRKTKSETLLSERNG